MASGTVSIAEVIRDPHTWDPRASTTPFQYIDISSIDAAEKRIVRVATVNPSEAPSRARQLVRSHDVLVSTVRPNLNAVAIVPDELDGATASTGFAVLRPESRRVDASYLYYWVRSPNFVRTMTARATGASYPAVTDRIVRESRLPLPPLAEQRRIASMLDKADAVQRKRRESLRLLDQLLRSAFLEMFGDPVRNERSWPFRRLDEVAGVQRGRFTPRPRNDPRFYNGPYPFIQTGDIARSKGVIDTWQQTLNEEGTVVSREFPRGTIALAIAANIADTAIVDFDFYCPDSVVGIVPNREIACSEYLETCLRFFKPALTARAPMTAQRNINLQVLRPLRLPVAPLELQERYRHLRQRVRHAASTVERYERATGQLFDSLAQRAFVEVGLGVA